MQEVTTLRVFNVASLSYGRFNDGPGAGPGKGRWLCCSAWRLRADQYRRRFLVASDAASFAWIIAPTYPWAPSLACRM